MKIYKLIVKGDLSKEYLEWLNGFELKKIESQSFEENKITKFNVAVADQSQLRGLLVNLFDLNMEIISFKEISDPFGKGGKDV